MLPRGGSQGPQHGHGRAVLPVLGATRTCSTRCTYLSHTDTVAVEMMIVPVAGPRPATAPPAPRETSEGKEEGTSGLLSWSLRSNIPEPLRLWAPPMESRRGGVSVRTGRARTHALLAALVAPRIPSQEQPGH